MISPTLVTVVEGEACHFCAEAVEVLLGLGNDYPLVVRTVDIRGPEGGALMRRHGAAMTPLVLLDGKFFSHGRLPQRKLRRFLTDRYDAALSEPVG
jgi:hypothetical protein